MHLLALRPATPPKKERPSVPAGTAQRTRVRREPVHLAEQLVQRLLALLVCAHTALHMVGEWGACIL